ncbi:arylamine N-acetyltransferase [Umezawaea endophytica]|uniref:Arylamine N-acetyltransferase n=1 Tax=Umezawaea endophytica TaxID=1654476 RepID=A0A9X3AIL9_9PSEU|nr:arylamine N-acetyltransferase [Umezawaea endophytica]MCS7482731.1 arylamine N-acetyltransferase [Umezawaea endophytica]
MKPEVVDAYLARIGATRTTALADLQELHLRAIPFENLSVHLGERIVLDEDALVAKIVERRRGGFCYELNGALAALLRALGHEVDLLGARVFLGERLSAPLEHVALRVGSTLVDVGFGDFSLRPLRLDVRDDQHDPEGVFRVVEAPDGDLDLLQDGEPQYRLDPRPRTLADFGPTCWYQQTSPDSHFTRKPLASMPTAKGRVTISGSTLITTEAGRRTERQLTDAEALDAYRGLFGIGLDAVPSKAPQVTSD